MSSAHRHGPDDTHGHPHRHDRPLPHQHDDGEQGHGHGAGRLARVRHATSELLGGHSHDAADQVDEALEADADGRTALLVSLAGLAVTAAVQGFVVALSGSVALLGDRCTTSPTP